jgi:hypothetical protein
MKINIQELSDKILVIQASMKITDDEQQLLEDYLNEHEFQTFWLYNNE